MPETMRQMLTAGRAPHSSGRVVEVVELVRAHPRKAAQLIECLWDEETGVALRAANALEKLTRTLPGVCDGWEAPLLGLLAETEQIKLRWSLALIVPRLKLTGPECRRTAEVLRSFLGDRSSIVKTCALQGLTDLSSQDASLLAEVVDLLRIHSRSGTAAMRARGRQLLKRLDAQPVSFPLRHGSDK